MRKKTSLFLIFILTFGLLPVSHQYEVNAEAKEVDTQSEKSEYELYPTPQDIEYFDGEFILDTEVNVVLEEKIDNYTKDRLEEVLALKDIKSTYSDEKVDGITNIFVGTVGSKGYVDSHFNENYRLKKDNLFEKIDSSYLRVEDNEITVLGKDTDSAFYAITTLYHIFEQMDSFTIENFVMEDYADVISRGFIEGYYGEPWSTEDRADLMEFGGYYKLNSYFYAPKDDPKHNANWRELYNDEEIKDMTKLAEAGNASKTRFVYAIHPFMNQVFQFNDNYDRDFKVLTDKFDQMLEAGVRQFSILGDDAGVPGRDANNYIRLLEDLTVWLEDKQVDYPGLKTIIPFVPNDYMGWGDSGQIQTLKDLPDNVQIVMTGGKVWGEVSQDFTSTFTKNAGRGPYMWINWPVTDNSKQHLIMGGGHEFLQPNVDPEDIEGIVLNPMQQSEPSKLSLFYNAAYSWNIWDDEEEALEAWERAFSYIDHNSATETEGSLAYKELAKHMINQDMDGRVVALEESIDLKPILNDFKNKLNKGTVTAEDVDIVIEEFETIKEAAKTYRNNPGNEKTRDQIMPWLNSWDDTNKAALSYLKAIKADLNGDQTALINLYAKAQDAFARSKTHGFSYIDHTEYAEVGVQHIVPFIETVGSYTTEKVNDATGLGDKVKFITNFTKNPEGGIGAIDKILDGKESTSAYWKNYFPQKGEYVGIDFKNEPQEVENFEFLLGPNDSLHDTFYNGEVQYTMDGKKWITIDKLTFSDEQKNKIEHTFDEPKVIQGIRVVNTKDLDDKWFGLREISYNIGDEDGSEEDLEYNIMKSDTWEVYQGDESSLYDGDDDSFVWYNPRPAEPDKDIAKKDDFLGYDLGRVVELDSLHLVVGHEGVDKLKNYAIETSLDNKDWTAVNDKYENFTGKDSGKDIIDLELDGLKAQYVRVRNLEDKASWLKFSEFTVKEVISKSTKNVYTNLEKSPLDSHLELGKASLTSGSVELGEGDYIGLILDHIKKITSADVDVVGENVVLEGSKNAYEWFEITEDMEFDARYVRLVNKSDKKVNVEVNKFDLNINEIIPANFMETDIPRHDEWSEEDVRLKNNGENVFDGDLQTAMTVSGYPKNGSTIIFDLGQERQINSMRYYIDENVSNYIRDAVFELGDDPQGEDWAELFTVGDGVEDNTWDESVAKDADYLTHDNENPGYMYSGNDDLDVQGRYLRVRFTTRYDHRFVGFNEIMINEGEYIPQEIFKDVESDSIEVPYQIASNMFDKNLDTAYQAKEENSEFTYHLSEPLSARRVKIIQSGAASNATVKGKFYTVDDDSMSTETVTLGKLSQTISEFDIPKDKILKNITISWTDDRPVISEIIQLESNSEIDKTKLVELINTDVETSEWTTDSQINYKNTLTTAKEVSENIFSSQSVVESAAASLQTAINSGVNKFDPVELEELYNDQISNEDHIYTSVSFTNYLNKLKPVENALEDKNNLGQDTGKKLVKDIKDAIETLEYSEYQRELAELKLRDFKENDLKEESYTSESFSTYISMIESLENMIKKDKDGEIVKPSEFMEEVENIENYELVNTLQLQASLEEFDNIDTKAYTNESYISYKDIADNAKILLVDGTKEEINQAVDNLKEARNALEPITEDIEAIEKIKRSIYNLPRASELTLADKSKVEEVRKMVNNLSDEDKEFVTSISQLEAREAKLDELTRHRQVKEVKRAIYNLPKASELTLADKDKVEKVREMVSHLADEDKEFITSISQLEAREVKLEELEK